jgi:hypothetical protein
VTSRFPGLIIGDWRTRVVHDHPRLFPDARLVHTADGLGLSSSGWPEVPDGWRTIVETACERLEEALADEPEADVAVLDIKEKHGTLRLSVSAIHLGAVAYEAVTLAVDLAEARSAHVCDTCGRRGRLSRRGRWYATRCEQHGDGFEPVRGRNPDLQIATRFVQSGTVRTARRYDPVTDAFVPAAIPDDEE